ncbi:NADH-quinone oxidoreductase subunit K [Desulfobacula toluolica]|uniref:MrpC: Na(+)/H(+) antiporter, subunit C (Multiple resistance and pH homeostasis protein C) n=1 Tax=Desulfobacula toluolica (strain DSM 7467 / Tol2) TaxID=651182 RepID=K0N2K8_DESTT|nr:NADH-quinone oxidoreductase subunit K [Desulfobacula toluolica]CCK78379.1 MrpC: Na(+)/H(+) antiporter, subunit C (Multiple resistance and pH homeostasis protein C) [Desulfobacula toluolica Tol2]
MEALMALVVGLMIAAALYLMLSGVLVRFVFGFTLMGNAINLLIFTAGRLTNSNPALIHPGQTILTSPAANALPQALILTAIVIGFAMTTFFLILLVRTFDQVQTLDADQPPLCCELPDTGLGDRKTNLPGKKG